MRNLLLTLALVLLATTVDACEPHLRGAGVQKIEGARYVLEWRAVPPIRVGDFFTLEIGVCARDGQPRPATLRVDATMPEHKHGMNYRPSVTPKGTERFAAEGLLFHMAGRWELVFEVNNGAERESFRTDVTLR